MSRQVDEGETKVRRKREDGMMGRNRNKKKRKGDKGKTKIS